MNKKIIAILLATLLFMGGVTSLLAEQTDESIEDSFCEPTDSPPPNPPIPCGGDNGGGDPG